MPGIELIGIGKAYHGRRGRTTAVHPLDLQIRAGEFFSLLGPSGCGKSTTLRMIAGFEDPTSGRILLSGLDVTHLPPNERDVNLVFQSYALFPHLDVRGNVAFGLRRRKVARDEVDRRVDEALALVSLDGYADRRPTELSGGQQQRVALARALVCRPRALLLDEPLGALDLKLRQTMQFELKRIQREVGITFVYVTHDQGEALTMSDRMAVMQEGRIEQLGTPRELFEQPRTRFVAGFIGTSNVLSRPVRSHRGSTAVLAADTGDQLLAPDCEIPVHSEVSLSVRPERIELRGEPGESDCHLRGTVVDVAYQGTTSSVTARLASGEQLIAAVPSAQVPRLGDELWLTWPPGAAVLLSPS